MYVEERRAKGKKSALVQNMHSSTTFEMTPAFILVLPCHQPHGEPGCLHCFSQPQTRLWSGRFRGT